MLDSARLRLTTFILLPVLLSGLCSLLMLTFVVAPELEARHQQQSDTISDYLAKGVSDHLVNDDVLGLNVLLADSLARGHFETAAVYNAKQQLVAQVGRRDSANPLYLVSRQVTYQDTLAGSVQAGFQPQGESLQPLFIILIAVHALLGSLFGTICWLRRDLLFFWLSPGGLAAVQLPANTTREHVEAASKLQHQDSLPRALPLQPPIPSQPASAAISSNEGQNAELFQDTAVLVLKFRPPRLFSHYEEVLTQVISLYGGDPIAADQDELVACFSSSTQLFRAVCAGLLALETIRHAGPPATLKAGLHLCPQTEEENELDKARKHASYLASISENQLLASRAFWERVAERHLYQSETFHSSMIPDDEVILINALTNQELIRRQSNQLAAQ